jgi:hypothetical protein
MPTTTCSPISKPPLRYGFEKGEAHVGKQRIWDFSDRMSTAVFSSASLTLFVVFAGADDAPARLVLCKDFANIPPDLTGYRRKVSGGVGAEMNERLKSPANLTAG